MAYLVDTSVLARLANHSDVLHAISTNAILELHRRGETLHITAQNLVEFRNVATRPSTVNGLGLTCADVETKAVAFESIFPLLPENPDIYPIWKALVSAMTVTGKQVHDARLVAVCLANGVTHLLTFNFHHFARLSSDGPGVIVVNPAGI